MTTAEAVPAFHAFESQLKTLCLTEFPCGIGSWRENHKTLKKTKQHTNNDTVATQFSITLKDYGAPHEKTETLQELVRAKRSPWNLDYSWSDEAKQLREIAVRSPWLIDENFILSHFKTLRIADKKVTDVDENFLMFNNLEELSLSANYLRTVHSANLPPNLQVLELCANQISNLAELCERPPPLIHLGLGHNQLTLVDDYISGDYWPELLSLDLSHNNLSDLVDIVRRVQSLPKLRNLLLQGNPLSLIAGYRGYTIDSLKNLDYLDDISISADERYHFKGLAKKREYVLDEAKVTLQVDFLKGIPMPEEMQNPEDQPEFPIVTRKYFVRFMYLEERSSDAEIFQLLYSDQLSTTGSGTQPTEGATTLNTGRESGLSTGRESGLTTIRESDVGESTESQPEGASTDRRSLHTPSVAHDDDPVPVSQHGDTDADTQSQSQSQLPCFMTQDEGQEGEGQSSEVTTPPLVNLSAINSSSSTWSENMELQWKLRVTRDDLLSMRNFFKQGMDIEVMEEKVLSYPAEQVQDGVLSPTPSSTKSKGKKGDKKDKKDDKKDAKGGKNDKPADDGAKKKKKKGEPEVELAHMPAEFTTLATFHIPLEYFLEGEFEFEDVFMQDSTSHSGMQSPTSEIGKKKDGKKEKKKPASAKKKDGKDATVKSPKASDKKDPKHKPKAGETPDDDTPPPPPPLEAHVAVRLLHWKTAMDSLKQEAENEPSEQETTQK